MQKRGYDFCLEHKAGEIYGNSFKEKKNCFEERASIYSHIRHLMRIKWLPRRTESLAVLSALDKTEQSVVNIKSITTLLELQVHCEGNFGVQSLNK